MSSKSQAKEWSPEEKFEAVIKAAQLAEVELGEYLRRAGLHSSDLAQWRKDVLGALAEQSRGRPKLPAELVELRKRNEQLEQDLRRKEKALAEASALLVLKKKAELIWGVREDGA